MFWKIPESKEKNICSFRGSFEKWRRNSSWNLVKATTKVPRCSHPWPTSWAFLLTWWVWRVDVIRHRKLSHTHSKKCPSRMIEENPPLHTNFREKWYVPTKRKNKQKKSEIMRWFKRAAVLNTSRCSLTNCNEFSWSRSVETFKLGLSFEIKNNYWKTR